MIRAPRDRFGDVESVLKRHIKFKAAQVGIEMPLRSPSLSIWPRMRQGDWSDVAGFWS